MRPQILFLLALGGIESTVVGQSVELVSQSTSGAPANHASYGVAMSSDGQVLAFRSSATNLASGYYPPGYNVYVRDRNTGTTELGAATWDGATVSRGSWQASLSADGRSLAFLSAATNIVAGGDANGNQTDLFVRDRMLGSTSIAARTSSGAQSNGSVERGAISADGAWIVFESTANDFVAGDTNGVSDVFVQNLQTGVVERVSLRANGSQAVLDSQYGSLSADGARVAFSSYDALVTADTNDCEDVYVLDRSSGDLTLASVTYGGLPSDNESTLPVLALDGMTVAFASNNSRLVPLDFNNKPDVFWRDLGTNTTGRASVTATGGELNGFSWYPTLSGDGRTIGFLSQATGVVPGVPALPPGRFRAYVYDRVSHDVALVEAAADGTPGDLGCDEAMALSHDGHWVAWGSASNNLDTGDAPNQTDVFVSVPSLHRSSVVERNGSGMNVVPLTSGLPILGADWSASLDCSAFGTGTAHLVVRAGPIAGVMTPFGERLVGGALVFQGASGFAAAPSPFTWAIPYDTALLGLVVHAQGLCRSAPAPTLAKARALRGGLSNALDLTVGF